MASLIDLHTAIEERLSLVDGLRVSHFPEPGLTPPIAWPKFTGWKPSAMGRQGWVDAGFDVHVFTSGTVRTRDGYRLLIDFADWQGSRSIWLALWDGNDHTAGTFAGLADTTLAVNVDEGFSPLGVEDVDAFELNGGVFAVTIHTKGP